MPPIFKALATISAWFLFIAGWLHLAPSTIFPLLQIGREAPAMGVYAGTAVGAACFILAVVAMRLRQKME